MSQAFQPRPGNAEIADRPARPVAGRPDSGADLPLVRGGRGARSAGNALPFMAFGQ